MVEKEPVLEQIVNIVVSPMMTTNHSEVYIATRDGEYCCVRIGGTSQNFDFTKLSASEYLARTQHLVASTQATAGSKIVR